MRDAWQHRGGATLPPEEEERWECQQYHCRPSALDAEDEWTLQVHRHLAGLRAAMERTG